MGIGDRNVLAHALHNASERRYAPHPIPDAIRSAIADGQDVENDDRPFQHAVNSDREEDWRISDILVQAHVAVVGAEAAVVEDDAALGELAEGCAAVREVQVHGAHAIGLKDACMEYPQRAQIRVY